MRRTLIGAWRSSRHDRFLLVGAGAGAFVVGVALAVLSWSSPPSHETLPSGRHPIVAARPTHAAAWVDLRDQALGRLMVSPTDLEAMDLLVRMQRFLAADRAEALRADAALYARAAKAGRETPQHLTGQAMRLLVLANLLAASQIELETGTQPDVAQASFPAAFPVPRALPVVAFRSKRASLRLSTTAPANQGEYFLVVSPVVPREEGQREATRFASAGFAPLLRRGGVGLVQIQLGAFADQANAEALATRVRARGLAVAVLRGAAGSDFEPVQSVDLAASTQAAPVQPVTFSELMRRGGSLYAAGWYGPALANFRQAARVRPDAAPAYLWWGRAAYKVNRIPEARGALRRAVDLAGTDPAGLQARILLQMVDAAGAVRSTPNP